MSEWISPNDRVPENRQTVLIFIKGKYTVGEWFEDDQEFDALCYTVGIEEVSYWMPLPEPPK